MAGRSVKVEGLKELEKALGELATSTQRNVLIRTLKKAAAPIEAAAEDMAPELSGDLQESLVTTTRRPKGQQSASRAAFSRVRGLGFSSSIAGKFAKAAGSGPVEIFIGPGRHPQGMQQEFGNVNHAAQPYLRPAFDLNSPASLAIIKRELKIEIEKSARRSAARASRRPKG